jgi:hypothetical protein
MITDAIVKLLSAVLGPILALLPSGTSTTLNSYATTVVGSGWFGHMGWLNDYVPVDQVVIAIPVVIAFALVMVGVQVTVWILDKLHLFGGGQS